MATRYLFSCPRCNHVIPVTMTQAGQDMQCPSCGQAFDVPQLQVLKRLETADHAPIQKPKTASRGAGNVLFVAGLMCLLIGSATGYGLSRYANSLIFEFENAENQIAEQASSLTPGGVLREWYLVEKKPDLPEWQEHPIIRNQKQGKILQLFAYGLWGVGGLGVLLIATSFLIKPNVKPR